MCLFPVFYAGSVFNRHKELVLVSALVYHPRPHRSFMATTDFFGVIFLVFVASTGILASRADENNNNIIFSSALQATNI